MQNPKIGILAYHGDVAEHETATNAAFNNLGMKGQTVRVTSGKDFRGLTGIIIPGGESSVMHRLSKRAGIFAEITKIKNIFGTCAGAIMLAKKIRHKLPGQESLELMDLEIDRNAYGRQTSSFETEIESALGKINAVFIRAPRILGIGKNVKVLAKNGDEIIACEQKSKSGFYLAVCFHPELTTTRFHEYFLKNLVL